MNPTQSRNLLVTECPRDAMQGLQDFVPTEQKIKYLNALLKVNFYCLDAGSFVSPRAIPQMRDTHEVLDSLDRSVSDTKISVIAANGRGVERALAHPAVDVVGFPFSVSPKFQELNTNKSQEEAFDLIKAIATDVKSAKKELLIFFSMSFGNPYGEPWSTDLVLDWVKRFADIGIVRINISDTIGVAKAKPIQSIFSLLNEHYPSIEFGAHFHTTPNTWHEKVVAAYDAGCRKFDGVIQGFGGCPMAESPMVGNMPTEKLISFAATKNLTTGINSLAFESAYNVANTVLH